MTEKKYTEDGYLIVAETDKCPLWEKDTKPCRSGWTHACFFCRFADFRTDEFIRRAEEMPRGTKLYSVCHNEKNKRKDIAKAAAESIDYAEIGEDGFTNLITVKIK